MRYEKCVNHCTIAPLVLETHLICVCEKRTKGFVTCLCNNFLHMGRQLNCFLTHQTSFTPGKAKLESKFQKYFILHTEFTLWKRTLIEKHSRVKPRAQLWQRAQIWLPDHLQDGELREGWSSALRLPEETHGSEKEEPSFNVASLLAILEENLVKIKELALLSFL